MYTRHSAGGSYGSERDDRFLPEHGIQLLVDAAHPFAEQLHKNIGQAAEELNIPVVRYERIYPPRDPDLIWCDSYAEACVWLKNQGIRIYWRCPVCRPYLN